MPTPPFPFPFLPSPWYLLPSQLQVQHYNETQRYTLHVDTLESWPNRRVATVLMYLNDVDSGGETFFPLASDVDGLAAAALRTYGPGVGADLERTGTLPGLGDVGDYCGPDPRLPSLRVTPRAGDAILFYSLTPGGALDSAAIHGSCPVVEGEKWVSQVRWPAFNRPLGNRHACD